MDKPKRKKTKIEQSTKAFADRWFDFYHFEKKCELYEAEGQNGERQIRRTAQMLGITPQALLAHDESAVKRWQKKYPFFELYDRFCKLQMVANNKLDPLEFFIFALFDSDGFTPPKKHDRNSIRERAIAILKDADKYLPGSYHGNAEMLNFSYGTTVFFSFPQVVEMITSFCDLADRAKELFFRAWREDLNDEEILEYDFLATFLQLIDRSFPSEPILYGALKKLVPIYLEEGNTGDASTFLNYFSFKFCREFTPWACKEFADRFDLAQKYATICPEAKSQMFDYGKAIKYFACNYRWSDDPAPLVFANKEEEEEYYDKLSEQMEEEDDAYEISDDDCLDEGADQPESAVEEDEDRIWMFPEARVLVPKTEEELGGDGDAAEKLIRLGGAPTQGGVFVSMPKWIPAQSRGWLARAHALGRC